MTSYYIEFTFGSDRPFDEAIEGHLDDLAEAFAGITDVDGDVGADLKAGRVDLCMTVNASDRSEALHKAFVAARTAVHAAGGHTGTWDGWLQKLLESDEYRTTVAPSSLRDYALGC
ncbi:hypothetical protein [Mycobacterium sp. 050134]|uniref:hypothetical protein n=1 Tax=Mycobacterium sp. 050134 TaxID=3096111 RepID=UPI002ED84541